MSRLLLAIVVTLLLCGCSKNTITDAEGYDIGYEAGYSAGYEAAKAEQVIPNTSIMPEPVAKPVVTQASPTPTPVQLSSMGYQTKVSGLPDFFSFQDNSAVFLDALEVYDFATILEMCNQYISANNGISEYDSVNAVKNLATEATKIAQNCSYFYDKMEDETTVFYKSYEAVGIDGQIIPYFRGSFYSCKAGFISDDWIFFDVIFVSADNIEPIKIMTRNTITDVLSNADIIEYAEISFSEEEMESLLIAEKPMIRFKNEDTEQYLDFKLNEDVLSGIWATYRASRIYVELSDLHFHWEYDGQ